MKEMQNWLKENLTEVWYRESLAYQLAWQQAFWLFCMWRLWIMGQRKVSQQIQGSDPEDEGGDEVPCQGHPGEGLHKLQVQDRGCLQLTAVLLNKLILHMYIC